MNKFFLALVFFFAVLNVGIAQQPSFTANTQVPTYNTHFRLGVNPGYNGPDWSDDQLADIAAGNPATGIETDGAGIRSFRVPLPESFLEAWGYDVRVSTFQHYDALDIKDNTVFLEDPSTAHKSTDEYCTGVESILFKNMYEPIWDGGANGTEVNENNYAALYAYKTVMQYKDYVKFWEIWNEPDFDYSNNGWKPVGETGNWWENVPDPCDIKIKSPVYHYIRLLRINYEVIKSVDPDAFITVGGLGYESFLDIILRFTDNPADGSVSTDFPLTGGAYFDALSIHTYPHQNGSLSYWDNGCSCVIDTRHSDAAATGLINHKNSFQNVLTNYGYDGVTYPKKITIVTETNVPNKQFETYPGSGKMTIGSYEAQRNYALKASVYSYTDDIRQLNLFKLADTESHTDATNWLQASGLYAQINNTTPYTVTYNEEGTATRTFTDLIFGATYDATRTQDLNLPSNISGAAFLKDNNLYTYVLWAKTETDQSETASATYSFPASLAIGVLNKKEWDFSVTTTTTSTASTNIDLTGAPIFLEETVSSLPVELINFELQNSNGSALLNWTTASERNNQGFEIQHSSNGFKWDRIGFVAGAGNSNQIIDYEFKHQNPPAGTNYYRLNQIDFDGNFSFSKVKAMKINLAVNLSVYPNPISDKLHIKNF